MDLTDKLHLYNCDNMEFMATIPDKYYDLSICDPPYGMPKDSTHGRGKLKNRILNNGGVERWDKKPTDLYFSELKRISKNQIIWGGNYFPLPPTRCVICWDKVQPWENFSQIELAWTSFDYPAQIFKFDNRTGDKVHPCQKPVAIYKWLLSKYAKKGDKIFDSHLGSMSIAIACHDYGFDLTGCELDVDYYNQAIERVKRHIAQPVLFQAELPESESQLTLF